MLLRIINQTCAWLVKLGISANTVIYQNEDMLNVLIKRVNDGDSNAQLQLANMHLEGELVKQDFSKAAELLKKSAESGNPEACYKLGKMYYEGWSLQQSDTKAIDWLHKAAYKRHAKAQYLIGRMLLNGDGGQRNEKLGIIWLILASIQGESNAQVHLGNIYRDGVLARQDDDESRFWYELASMKGNSFADLMLGLCYLEGKGIKRDLQKAERHLLKASISGNTLAQYHLGMLYFGDKNWYFGDSLPERIKLKVLDTIYLLAKKLHIFCSICFPPIRSKAIYWLHCAASGGNADAQEFLGLIYYNGNGVKKDLLLAYMLFHLSGSRIAERKEIEETSSLTDINLSKQFSMQWLPGTGIPASSKDFF